jgi:heat shock protein HslJ
MKKLIWGLGMGLVGLGCADPSAIVSPSASIVPASIVQAPALQVPASQALTTQIPASQVPPSQTPPSSGEPVPNTSGDQLANTAWLLEDLGGTGVIDDAQTTLQFDDAQHISGRGGCNQYRATVQRKALTTSEISLTIGAIASTKRLCVPALMDQETRFFRALEQAERAELNGPYLLIYSSDREGPLRFTRWSGSTRPDAPRSAPARSL